MMGKSCGVWTRQGLAIREIKDEWTLVPERADVVEPTV